LNDLNGASFENLRTLSTVERQRSFENLRTLSTVERQRSFENLRTLSTVERQRLNGLNVLNLRRW
jgi:hypothetical protein